MGNDDTEYYCLIPVDDADGKIYTPIGNDKVVMRKVLTKKEAMELIDKIPHIEQLWITDEKQREADYKRAIHSCDCYELIRIIKTMYLRTQERIAKGMKSTVIDEKYLKEAERNLYSELSMAIGKTMAEMPDYIASRLEPEEA
jgi:CarD family transcriptional regulator